MSLKNWLLGEKINDYLIDLFVKEAPILQELRERIQEDPMAHMQIQPLQGAFMQWLIRAQGTRNILELGTYMGYSALTLALALPAEGRLITCDISKEWGEVAISFWKKAQVLEKIDFRLGPALETLQNLLQEKQSFDMIFIDANKSQYPLYYETCYELLRPGGILLLDNVLWYGGVVDQVTKDSRTLILRNLNEKISEDPRVEAYLLPLGDGLLMAMKKVVKPK